jgi:hypothetical protein
MLDLSNNNKFGNRSCLWQIIYIKNNANCKLILNITNHVIIYLFKIIQKETYYKI